MDDVSIIILDIIKTYRQGIQLSEVMKKLEKIEFVQEQATTLTCYRRVQGMVKDGYLKATPVKQIPPTKILIATDQSKIPDS
jgi:hypothetical protein